MFDFISQIKGLLKTKQLVTDGRIFRLHYRVTAFVLFVCCILVTSRQYFGEPIACMTATKDQIPENVINSYCWVQATFSSPSQFGKVVGKEVAHQGVGISRDDEDVRYYKYYQWVGFVLFFQAIMFYAPRYFWKGFERNTVKEILLGLNRLVVDENKTEQDQEILTDYLKTTARKHNWYALKYYFCEVLAFANVVGQIYFVNRFLDGEFTTYGTDVINFVESDQDDRFDPMVWIFPRVTKCLFHNYGPTGEIQRHAALCVLPLNIVNEKIYVFIWFWFVILAGATGLLLLMRILTLVPAIRFYFLRVNHPIIDKNDARLIIDNTSLGDWLLLYFLGKNMESHSFNKTIKKLSSKLDNSYSKRGESVA